MLLETRETLRKQLKKYLAENDIKIGWARLVKHKIAGFHINTIYMLISSPKYKAHNYTIIKLLDFLEIKYDKTYYEENDIVKLLEKKELEN